MLERWNPETGERLQRLERDVEWFPPNQVRYGEGLLDPDQEPIPGLMEIDADATGRLWIAIHVADRNWKAGFEDGQDYYGRSARRFYDLSRYYDTIIEVISPVERRVLGRTRLDGDILNFVGDGLVATKAIEPPGYPVIRIWRIEPAP